MSRLPSRLAWTLLAALSIVCLAPTAPTPSATAGWDVVVYGATPAGVTAAIAAAREHVRVVLLEPTNRIGGMMTSGLGASDVGATGTIGGLALDFFRRLGRAYDTDRYGQTVSWNLTPGVAEATFATVLAEAHVPVLTGQRLHEPAGVTVRDGRIVTIAMESGRSFSARVFIDATYEGDLMAQAGGSFIVGREAASQYGESLAGVRPPQEETPAMPANSASGSLAPGVDPGPVGAIGSADARVQPYDFRLCVTTNPTNQVAFPRPDGYEAARYVLLQRHLEALQHAGRTPGLANVVSIVPLPEGKADLNAAGPLSTDLLGGSDAYPNATYAERQAIWEEHYRYEAGLLYYLANDPSVLPSIRFELDRWGLCRDEFSATQNWPPELYVREARRMVSDFVLTQRDLMDAPLKADTIGIASYRVDAHPTRLLSGQGSTLAFEGELSAPIPGPYEIPYRILVPRKSEVLNLLDPVTVSASHVAFASVRMEPQFMTMGEAAGAAAALAVKSDRAVQDVAIPTLQAMLLAHHAIIRVPPPTTPGATSPPAPPTVGAVPVWLVVLVAVGAGLLGFGMGTWKRRRRTG